MKRALVTEDEIRLRAYYGYMERWGEASDEVSEWRAVESEALGDE